MNANIVKKQEKRKTSPIRDLTRIKTDFREAAQPLTAMLEDRLSRLETASANAIPYILTDIQRLSDGIAGIEALFGVLIGHYCDLGDRCLFLENQWRGAWDTVELLKEALHRSKVEAVEIKNQIDQHEKQSAWE